MNERPPFELLRLEGPVIPAELVDARSRGQAVIARAEREAERIRAGADTELEAARNAAIQALEASSKARLRLRLKRLSIAHRLRRTRLCEAAVDACLAVAEQVWQEPPADRGPVIRAVARALLARVPPGQELAFELHPSDLGLLPEGLAGRANAMLQPGDLIGRFEGGGLDARAETRAAIGLDTLAKSLGRVREEVGS